MGRMKEIPAQSVHIVSVHGDEVKPMKVISGGGGGSGNTLLATLSMGTISTSSTSATDTGKSISVSGINSYDALIVETSVDTKTNNRHACTTAFIWLTASSTIGTKNGGTIIGNKWNCKLIIILLTDFHIQWNRDDPDVSEVQFHINRHDKRFVHRESLRAETL